MVTDWETNFRDSKPNYRLKTHEGCHENKLILAILPIISAISTKYVWNNSVGNHVLEERERPPPPRFQPYEENGPFY